MTDSLIAEAMSFDDWTANLPRQVFRFASKECKRKLFYFIFLLARAT